MRLIPYIAFVLLVCFSVKASKAVGLNAVKGQGIDTLIKADDPIAAMLDSLKNVKFFQFEQQVIGDISKNTNNYDKETVPVFDQTILEQRMAKLDASSPFKLDYNNIVRTYIDMYTIRKRHLVSRMLGLSQMYFPIFEEALDKHNLPLELKYLAIVESALNPTAVSPVGATGLWQFMYGTGKMFDLNVTSYTDDRRDPYKATEAACQYFKFLYNMFGDWQLVLAAYNSGPGNVNKAIRRSGGKRSFWEIMPYLPKETQGYVPAFIAVTYVMNHTAQHNLFPVLPKTTYFKVDTVKTRQQVSFYQLSTVLDVPVEDLEYLNPMYKHKIIPYTEEGSTLVLPVEKIGAYVTNENTIYALKTPKEKQEEELAFLARQTTYKEVLKVHKVRKGESLTSVAKKYHCTSAELKQWNHLKSNKVPAGKRLNVYVKIPTYHQETPAPAVAAAVKKVNASSVNEPSDSVSVAKSEIAESKSETEKKTEVASSVTKKTTPKVVYYKVQKGETLWRIAQKYEGVTVDQLRAWNKIYGNHGLKAGTKIKVNIGS